jgi:hypothetical protein
MAIHKVFFIFLSLPNDCRRGAGYPTFVMRLELWLRLRRWLGIWLKQ